MRILYSAIDQEVPGTKGGSVHVAAVAEGLAALGHEVTALITLGGERREAGGERREAGGERREAGGERREAGGAVHWVPMPPPFGSTHLRLARSRAIAQLARGLKPDAIIERYHNFGGEAIRAARTLGAVAVLEVNAPVIDHPGSRKALLDRLLVVAPMRRWRDRLCRLADLVVTPNPSIVPAWIPRDRVAVLEWGADTERFHPGLAGPAPYARPPVQTLAVFAGAFRAWHGAAHLVRAIRELHARGRAEIGAVLIGDGPELAGARAEAAGHPSILFTGALPHDVMPAALAAADIGVAPFDVGAHGPLSLGFYWSPLKMFEYMAAGLPVVAPAVDRIPSLVAHEREGLLYDPAVRGALADSLAALADPAVRRRLGAAARARAVRDYSWAAHCRALEAAILARRSAKGAR